MDYTKIQEKMEKTINNFAERLSEIRAGRANPAILNKVKIDYYEHQHQLIKWQEYQFQKLD